MNLFDYLSYLVVNPIIGRTVYRDLKVVFVDGSCDGGPGNIRPFIMPISKVKQSGVYQGLKKHFRFRIGQFMLYGYLLLWPVAGIGEEVMIRDMAVTTDGNLRPGGPNFSTTECVVYEVTLIWLYIEPGLD